LSLVRIAVSQMGGHPEIMNVVFQDVTPFFLCASVSLWFVPASCRETAAGVVS
jgi:hypothetical protein